MSTDATRALTVVLTAVLTLSGTGTAQQPLFRSGTEIVDLYVTVTDDEGRLVPNLTREDFAIFDDRQPRDIVVFENDVQPVTVVVMLDTSASMTASLDLLKAGAEQFLIRMLPDDQGRVGAFNDKIQILPASLQTTAISSSTSSPRSTSAIQPDSTMRSNRA